MPMEHEPTRSPRELPLSHLWLQAVFAAFVTWMGVLQFGIVRGLAAGAGMLGVLIADYSFERRRRRLGRPSRYT